MERLLKFATERCVFHVEERPLSSGLYSDDAIIVHFLPVSTFDAPQRLRPEKVCDFICLFNKENV